MNTTPSETLIQSEVVDFINSRLVAPYFNASTSSLGGSELWICIAVSLEAKGTWSNNIFENSRYARFALTIIGGHFDIERFSGTHKSEFSNPWRRSKAKSLEEVVQKINAWVKINLDAPRAA